MTEHFKTTESLVTRLHERAEELDDTYDARLMKIAANTIESLWSGIQKSADYASESDDG